MLTDLQGTRLAPGVWVLPTTGKMANALGKVVAMDAIKREVSLQFGDGTSGVYRPLELIMPPQDHPSVQIATLRERVVEQDALTNRMIRTIAALLVVAGGSVRVPKAAMPGPDSNVAFSANVDPETGDYVIAVTVPIEHAETPVASRIAVVGA